MDFENIKSKWENQPQQSTPDNGSSVVKKKVSAIKSKQKITNIILAITVLILGGFFAYIAAYKEPKAALGLLLMIGALVVRIAIETISRQKLRKLPATQNANSFKEGLEVYYQKRKKVHYIITPLLIAMYAIGFVIMLPLFKASLSSGFYTYIVISAIVFLLVFCGFIYHQIKKELGILKELQEN